MRGNKSITQEAELLAMPRLMRSGKGRSMLTRFYHWLVLPALLFCISGAWAQSTVSEPIAPKGIDPALLAKARAGSAKAQFELCAVYLFGQKDYAQAASWCLKAAEQGSGGAQDTMGWFYYKGMGVPQDYAQAASWYRKAAEQGNADAEYALGNIYWDGKGVQRDAVQADIWYRKAAEQGDPKAQYDLSLWYAAGVGVPQDYSEAYFWASLAAATTNNSDDTMSIQNLTSWRDGVAAHLTKAELLKAQDRAREWFEDHQTKRQ